MKWTGQTGHTNLTDHTDHSARYRPAWYRVRPCSPRNTAEWRVLEDAHPVLWTALIHCDRRWLPKSKRRTLQRTHSEFEAREADEWKRDITRNRNQLRGQKMKHLLNGSVDCSRKKKWFPSPRQLRSAKILGARFVRGQGVNLFCIRLAGPLPVCPQRPSQVDSLGVPLPGDLLWRVPCSPLTRRSNLRLPAPS